MIEVKIKTKDLDFPDVLDASLPVGTEFEYPTWNGKTMKFRVGGQLQDQCFVCRIDSSEQLRPSFLFNTCNTKIRITYRANRPCCCQCQCSQKSKGLQLKDIEPGSVVRLLGGRIEPYLVIRDNFEPIDLRSWGNRCLLNLDFSVPGDSDGLELDRFEVVDKLNITQEK